MSENLFSNSRDLYTEYWRNNLSKIEKSLFQSYSPQEIQLDRNDFYKLGNRKSYSFNIEYINGEKTTDLGGSAIARDLDKVLHSSKSIESILNSGHHKINLDSNYVLNIRRFNDVRIFGEIPGFPEGAIFNNRKELSVVGVHRPPQAGISGSENEGADSIVLSGGYKDDKDYGDKIIYTGHGGRKEGQEKHTFDQTLKRGNKAIALNIDSGFPIRIIRGSNHNSPYSPENGYRYDGLFRAEKFWSEDGKDGFKVYRYYLTKIKSDSPEIIHETVTLPTGEKERRTITTYVTRIVRDTNLSKKIKELYNYRCQICGISLSKKTGPYIEGAHIKPIGEPHNGPDAKDNIICLCPNHHVEFDGGTIGIKDDLSLIGIDGQLQMKNGHELNKEFLRYHREINELE